jgi:hypothetical protein
MKKLTLIFTLLFSTVMFSSPSYAEWTKLNVTGIGNTVYINFERIRKVDGYVYYGIMIDSLKPNPKTGALSGKIYNQGDCELFRFKTLSSSSHKEPMGGGSGKILTAPNPKWKISPPNSSNEFILKIACKGWKLFPWE